MNKLKELLKTALVFMKIGLFTFGGGYAMIGVIESECIKKRQWMTKEELADMVAVSESTPGPVAINCATFLGFKRLGFLGALFSTTGVVLPSFIIIYVISLFFNDILAYPIITKALKGVRIGVGLTIACVGIKMFREIKKTPLTVTLFCASLIFCIVSNVLTLNLSSVFVILFAAAVGMLTLAAGGKNA